jgi:hypothetical protein
MADSRDDAFYDRADAHIHLSNDQTADAANGKVSASMMYATARFNIWLTALGHESSESMTAARDETIAYFLNSYRSMLDEHFDDYIANFTGYMKPREK